MNRIDELMKRLTVVKKQEDELEKEESRIKKELFGIMQSQNIRQFETARLKVTLMGEQIRTKIDADALKKHYPDIAEQYSKTTIVKPFCKAVLVR